MAKVCLVVIDGWGISDETKGGCALFEIKCLFVFSLELASQSSVVVLFLVPQNWVLHH